MGLLKLIKAEEPKSQEERFYELAEKYGLYGKVVLHDALNIGKSGYTLYPIVEEKGEIPPSLPGGFIEELLDLLYSNKRKKYPERLGFEISFKPMTVEDVKTAQRVWAMICDANND